MTKTRSRGMKTALLRALRIALWVIAAVAVVVFLGVLAYVTLTPIPDATSQAGGNTHPGGSIRLYLDQPDVRTMIIELGGNLLLLAPLGVLLPLLDRRLQHWYTVTLLCAAISACIEVFQGVFVVGRAFDIDDFILNTAGALLAYLVIGRRLGKFSAHLRASTKRLRRRSSRRARG